MRLLESEVSLNRNRLYWGFFKLMIVFVFLLGTGVKS